MSSRRRWLAPLTALALLIPSAVALPAAQSAALDIPPADYQQVSLASGAGELGEPMSLAVLPSRSVLHTARNGTVRVTDANGNTKVAANIPVYTHDEEGMQGVAVDPGFATNRFIYLYYAPPLNTPGGDAPVTGTDATWNTWRGEQRLSRFTLRADETIDTATERIVMRVPADRGICCHVGGDIDFDAAGNLYLTTGDDSNPFDSAGYSPIDERTNRNPAYDAQRSAGNTNDLRGKVLRIKPQADGTYTIPSGNLFAPGTANTRPEIYAMGFRNPFRMSVDKPTGIVYLGDYGPDAGAANASRGPGGQVEFDRITSPGNYGWPYCTGTNTTNETYNEFTFPNGPSQAKYNCTGGPANNSFRNTGQGTLPGARPSWIKYGDAGSPPEFGSGSESPMGGPVYRFDAGNPSRVKFPQSLNGRYFAGEYGRRFIKAIEVLANGNRGIIEAFPWRGTQVMDMAFGPDGALYVLDYGTGNNNQGLFRIEFIGTANRNPIANATATPTSGTAPLTVAFSSAGSSDPEGGPLTYRWTFGDGATSTAANPSHTYTATGTFTATLTVTDNAQLTAGDDVTISTGNTAPTVNLNNPVDGQLFSFGDTVPFNVAVSDPEDGQIDCTRVKVTYLLGHDAHSHQITSQNGCTGSIAIPTDGEHDAAANLYGVFDAEYTDAGGLTTHSIHRLQPRHRQAEHFSAQQGVTVASHTPAEGASTISSISNNDWISFTPYALGNANQFTARVAAAAQGGTIEVRSGSATGTLLGTATVPVTGGVETYVNVTANLTNVSTGTINLFLVFHGAAGQANLFDLDAFTFGSGAPTTQTVEGEAFTSQLGVQPANHAGASGGQTVGFINNGDWAAYSQVNTAGARSFSARTSSAGVGGTIQIRSGSQTGTILGSVTVPVTGSWDTFTTISTTLTGNATGPLFLTFTGAAGSLFDIDTFTITR